MKLTDVIITAIIKKGVLYEARNVDIDINIPTEDKDKFIIVNFKADNMTIKVEKDN